MALAIHLLGLRVKLNFNIPMDSTKSVGRRTLHMSVCMTASQYYALATSPLGEPIAQVVRYGPCGTHGIVFRPSLDVVRSRFAKTLSRLRTPVGGVREGGIAYGAPRAARRRNYGRA